MSIATVPAYEALAADIKNLGTECVFGLMSDDTALLVTTLDAMGVRFHAARHENTACAMAEGAEGHQVAPGPAAEIQQFEGRCCFDELQQRVDVLAHVVIARAFPVALCVLVVVGQRACGDLLQFVRAECHADASRIST